MRNQQTLINSSAICGVMSIHCVRQSRASERFPSINNWAAFLRFNARRLHITDTQINYRQTERDIGRQADGQTQTDRQTKRQRARHTDRQTDWHGQFRMTACYCVHLLKYFNHWATVGANIKKLLLTMLRQQQ